MGKGVRECPHCGALQTAVAIRTHSAIDFPNGVPARMTQRMLVPYPSVPEEVETATNIARQRAQAIRRVLFGVTTSALCAGALVLAVGPGVPMSTLVKVVGVAAAACAVATGDWLELVASTAVTS